MPRFRFLLGLAAAIQAAVLHAAPSLELTAASAPGPIKAIALAADGSQLLAGPKGLWWRAADAATSPRLDGAFASVDVRPLGNQQLIAALDGTRQQVMLLTHAQGQTNWPKAVTLPVRDFALNGVCLYREASGNLFAFVVGEGGHGEQWLIAAGDKALAAPRLVRSLPLPPEASHCQVDDASAQLFVNESGIGWWQYPAGPDARDERTPVDLRQPFGAIAKEAGALAVVPGGVLGVDTKAAMLHLYQPGKDGWQAVAQVPLAGLKKPEALAVRADAQGLQVLVQDDADGSVHSGRLDWQPVAPAVSAPLLQVHATVQTEPVARQGDAADDPAIWVHPGQPGKSLVLGTNKKQGLLVYGLDGKLRQSLEVGRLNNVDVRPGFELGGRQVDLAVATQRDRNSLVIFAIDRQTGRLTLAGEVPTALDAIYGMCLYKGEHGIEAIANDKDGRFVQYRLRAEKGRVAGDLVREFRTDSQPEGCVADDAGHRLFIGEEDVGVWTLDARAESPAPLAKVIDVGGPLQADVEGLALYRKGEREYLVISSQGNDSYLVLDAEPPFALRGAFQVGLSAEHGIDGTSETDGIEVTSANLGGAFGAGLLVVQDGRKRMPQAAQNFKLVPWQAVAKGLALP